MATGVSAWSTTASNNATADSAAQWPEGMAPSQVNDSARGGMASVAKWRDDISGVLATTGTSTAYTLTSSQGFASLSALDGMTISFTPHATNGDSPTLSVDGLAAKPIRSLHGVALGSGVLISGSPYTVLYSNANSEFVLHGMGGNTYGIPLAGGMDYWADTTPSSAYAFPTGQAISRTAYATLFNLVGTKFGIGDGSTTFNLPDKTGRASVMIEGAATRLTSSYFGGDSTKIGATGGEESITLITGNLPPYTPSVSVSSSYASSLTITGAASSFATGSGDAAHPAMVSNGTSTYTLPAISNTVTASPQGGTSTPVKTVQPTIACNYIIRII